MMSYAFCFFSLALILNITVMVKNSVQARDERSCNTDADCKAFLPANQTGIFPSCNLVHPYPPNGLKACGVAYVTNPDFKLNQKPANPNPRWCSLANRDYSHLCQSYVETNAHTYKQSVNGKKTNSCYSTDYKAYICETPNGIAFLFCSIGALKCP